MTPLARLSLISVVFAMLAACGVNPADSGKVWRSVTRTLGADRANEQALTASFSFDVDCENGGEAEMEAALNIDDETEGHLAALFGWQIRYDACQPDDNTLDGQLDYDAIMVADETEQGGLLTVRTTYQGTVTSTGETNGTCEIDVVGTLDAAAYEVPGEEFHAQADASYTGTICGNEVDEVFSASADIDADDA
ncbi:MAG: hypothetical protein HYS27_12490 [Deltaproteobacteria bacterium]|nr:hypothetical protein [Deltaproteobacteria bacterium]